MEPSCKEEHVNPLSSTPEGLFYLRSCSGAVHGGETSDTWMDELFSSVVVLLLLLPVIAIAQVTGGKLSCSPWKLQVKCSTLVCGFRLILEYSSGLNC